MRAAGDTGHSIVESKLLIVNNKTGNDKLTYRDWFAVHRAPIFPMS